MLIMRILQCQNTISLKLRGEKFNIMSIKLEILLNTNALSIKMRRYVGTPPKLKINTRTYPARTYPAQINTRLKNIFHPHT